MIHHVTAVNMLPLPQTDVIDGNSGGGRYCVRLAPGGGGWRGVQISGMYSYRVQTDAMDDVGS